MQAAKRALREREEMKFLIYGLNYSPELTGIGKYNGELAKWLRARGHEVVVIAAPPYYPEWRVGSGYRSSAYLVERDEGVRVIRCPLWIPMRPRGVTRILHLASFAISSAPVIIYQVFRARPDIVFVVEPPFMCAPMALIASKLAGVKSWIHVQDFEVDAAFDLGLLKGALLKNVAFWLERRILKLFDISSTISGKMLSLLRSKGVQAERSVLFPNWVDLSSVGSDRSDDVSQYRRELGIPSGSSVALYSGNMGAKQGLEILAKAARILCDKSNLYFVFCGNGAARGDLEIQVRGLPNVRMLDLQPMERFGELLAAADIHLLPQRADAADLVMPSKLTGILASGRAVVATAHEGTEVATVVNGCGLVVEPEDAEAFSKAIWELASNVELRTKLGQAGRMYAERYLDRDQVLKAFELDVERLVSE